MPATDARSAPDRGAEGRLAGRVALVTGAAAGIGRATVTALAREGASVVIADLDGKSAHRAAEEIRATGRIADSVKMDGAVEADVARAVAFAVERFGGLDVLHNNAAESSRAVMSQDLDVESMEVSVWDQVMAVNLRGVMLGCKHALPVMLARGRGSIINTSSAAALAGDLARPAYGASKAGLNALTEYVATQYGKRGIRCNAIAPGVIETPALARNVSEDQIAVYVSCHLTPRLGRPEDIADAVVFLASDESAFVTGQVLRVDGGLMSHHPTYAQFSTGSGS